MTAETAANTEAENPSDATLTDIIAADVQEIKEMGIPAFIEKYDGVLLQFGVQWGLLLIAAFFILILGWSAGSWIDRRFDRFKRLDGTLKNFLGAFFKYLIITVSVITVIGLFGIPMASLLAVLGAAGLAIGLALQGTLSNIASGVMLLILRPFNVGDYIEFGNEAGTVKTLGLFGTELSKADNVYVFAPNSRIWGNEIRNYSRNMYRRQDIVVGIDYNDDVNKAIAVLNGLIQNDERILQESGKEPQIITDKLNDYTIDIIVRFWSKTSDYWALRWDMNKKIKDELEKVGINLALVPRQMAIEDQSPTSPTAQK